MPLYEFEGKFPKANKALIAQTATLIGDIEIGAETSVWPGAVLRGDFNRIVIGKRSNVQDNAVIHSDIVHGVRIGDGVTIAHNATIHGCAIGNNCVIAPGAIVYNGSKIGEYTIVGMGCVILEDQTIPRRSIVVGLPGKVVKQASDDQKAFIERNAQTYLELAKRHKSLFATIKRK